MNDYERFKALSDQTRIEILMALKNREMNAGELAKKFSIKNSRLSYHLGLLKEADMIVERKYKNYIFYKLNLKGLKELSKWFDIFIK